MIRKITVAAAACVLSSAAWCIDGVALEYGRAEIGFTPVFRFERRSIYLEGAIGFHLVQTHISAARTFSTAFQFAEHLGAGLRSGKTEVGLHAQHLSNGGVAKPNPGINFLLVRVHYELD